MEDICIASNNRCDVCGVTLSVHHGGNRTRDLWDTSPNALPTELRGQVASSGCISELSLVPLI